MKPAIGFLAGLVIGASAHAEDVTSFTLRFREHLLDEAISSKTSVVTSTTLQRLAFFGGGRWHTVTSTVFYVGEPPAPCVHSPSNSRSAFDSAWLEHYGGIDSPTERAGYLPAGFTPGMTPFYVSLPVCDVENGHTVAQARNIPWFTQYWIRDGQSVLAGRWLEIRARNRVCFAELRDCGPWHTDDWQYCFGDALPRPSPNGSGIDISPAVRDYLQIGDTSTCSWRWVERPMRGPWTDYRDTTAVARLEKGGAR